MPRGSSAKQLEIEERRRKVLPLYLAHVSQNEIGRQLGVSQQTVSTDVKAIRKEYRCEREDIFDREVLSLDQMERDCAVEWQRTKAAEWLKIRLSCKERRAKLLGLDAPTKQEVTGADGGALKVEYVNDWRGDG